MALFSRRECIRSAGIGLASCVAASVRANDAGWLTGHEATYAPRKGKRVAIPAGNFLMGSTPQEVADLAHNYGYDASWMASEQPQHVVYLPAYAIQKYPVTNREYALFCALTGHPRPAHWFGGVPAHDILAHPVTWVNRADANAYAAWVGMRLPTEAEWEKAARGTNGSTWPWGNTFDPNACQWDSTAIVYPSGTSSVFAHPSGASPYGVMDMIGNVAEWCADGPASWSAYVKGGAWISREVINLRPAARNMSGNASNWTAFYGFRCAEDLP